MWWVPAPGHEQEEAHGGDASHIGGGLVNKWGWWRLRGPQQRKINFPAVGCLWERTLGWFFG